MPPMRLPVDTLGLGVAAAALYFGLLQEALWGVDGANFYQLLRAGLTGHGYHLVGLRLIGFGSDALGLLGLDLLHSASGACALATALAVMAAHRAALLWLEQRALAAAAAALFACLPTTVFFATVIELPGVFVAASAGACLAAARYAAHPSGAAAVRVGVLTALAALVHATGHLLPLCVGAFVLGRVQGWRRSSAHASVVLATHVTVTLAVSAAATGFAQDSAIGAYALGQLHRLGNLRELPGTLLHEYLIPLFPVSLVLAVAGFDRRRRRPALWMNAAALGVTAFSALLLGGVRENGCYFALLTVPAALVAAQVLGSARRVLAAAVAAALVGVVLVWQHEAATAPRFSPSEVRQALGSTPALVVIADPTELLPVLRVEAAHDVVDLVNFLGFAWPMPGPEKFDAGWRMAAAQGRPVFVTDRALVRLRDLDHALFDHLQARYRLTERRAGRLVVHEVARSPDAPSGR